MLFYWAIQNFYTDIVQVLIDNCSDTNVTTISGDILVQIIGKANGYTNKIRPIVNILFKNGFDIDKKDALTLMNVDHDRVQFYSGEIIDDENI